MAILKAQQGVRLLYTTKPQSSIPRLNMSPSIHHRYWEEITGNKIDTDKTLPALDANAKEWTAAWLRGRPKELISRRDRENQIKQMESTAPARVGSVEEFEDVGLRPSKTNAFYNYNTDRPKIVFNPNYVEQAYNRMHNANPFSPFSDMLQKEIALESLDATATHERAHALNPKSQRKVILGLMKQHGIEVADKYMDDPEEIYARLMSLRKELGLKPGEKVTKDEWAYPKNGHQILDRYRKSPGFIHDLFNKVAMLDKSTNITNAARVA